MPAAVSARHFEDQPADGYRNAARRQCFDAHGVDAGGQAGGIQRHAQLAVGILEQIVEHQRAALVLLVDEQAKLHEFLRVAEIDVHVHQQRRAAAQFDPRLVDARSVIREKRRSLSRWRAAPTALGS